MTINDLLEQSIIIQGAFTIKHWDDDTETYDILAEGSMFEDKSKGISKEYLNAEIKYVYCQDNVLNIEV
ncbi:hypothetical protein [Anaerovorax sp. IOR16]|uniref:hypothetical protein n=1 Tax=Anaerovorax sp. IOR16 TaxID=2773458 RepID=UPI0019D062C5|nr:hypothetical protein [Anaerovorax sp. IOR16]